MARKMYSKEMDRQLFYGLVYEIVKLIPPGRVTCYGSIARAMGRPTTSRRVGEAMAVCRNHEDYIPAHRVVSSSGHLIGKEGFEDPDQMQRLLEEEGIRIAHNRVQDFRKVFWDPINEID